MADSNLLFHYTSLEGFLNIIDKSCLWASHLNFMNDYTEGKMFLDALEAEIWNDNSLSESHFPDVPINVRNAIEEFCWWKIPRFSISFCEHQSLYEIDNGLLSQWRGYGQGGIALAFNKIKLLEACKNLEKETGWVHSLKPVNYVESIDDISKKLGLLNFGMNDFLEFASTIHNGSIEQIGSELKFKPVIDALINIAPFVKHASFAAEHEYRLAIAPDYFERNERLSKGLTTGKWNPSDLSVKFRVGNGKLIPYLEGLRFKSEDLWAEHPVPQGLISCLVKVIIGPSKMSAYNFLATKAFLSNRGITISVSDIPYT